MNIQKWWEDHKADEEAANTFIHKHAFGLLLIVTICLLLSLCSNAKHAMFGMNEQPAPAAVSCESPAAFPLLSESYAQHWTTTSITRDDGGAAFYVPLEQAGDTTLVTTSIFTGTKVIGTVHNDPATFSTIINVGNVWVGVKPDASY